MLNATSTLWSSFGVSDAWHPVHTILLLNCESFGSVPCAGHFSQCMT